MAGSTDSKSEEKESKPCRACSDFREWTKNRKKNQENLKNQKSSSQNLPADKEADTEEDSTDYNKNCPLNRDELGRRTWGFLHTLAAYYPEHPTQEQKEDVQNFFKLFSRFYPCSECAEDLQQQLERFPPKTESQEDLSQWLCRVHNRINLKLGKPLFDCSSVNERWRDGWKDGSCD